MKPVHVRQQVNRSADDVFAFLSDYENNPKFMGGIVSATWTSDRTYDQVATMVGKRIESSFELVEREPPRRLKVASTKGPFPIQETRAITAVSESACRIDVTVEGEPSGFFGRVMAPLLPALVRRSVQRDYKRLAALLE